MCRSASRSPQPLELDLDDLLELRLGQGVEDDDLVHPVEELRPEVLPQLLEHRSLHPVVRLARRAPRYSRMQLAADVRGHDDRWCS